MSQSDYSNKQFIWFSLENKARQLVQELLFPLQAKIHEERQALNSLRREFHDDHLLLASVAQIVNSGKRPEEMPIFKRVFEEMMQLQEKMARQEQSMELKAAQLEGKVGEMGRLQEGTKALLCSSEAVLAEMKSEFASQRTCLQKISQSQLKQLRTRESDLMKTVKQVELQVTKLSQLVAKETEAVQNCHQFCRQLDQKIKEVGERQVLLKASDERLSLSIQAQQEELARFGKQLEQISKFQVQVAGCEAKLQRVQDYSVTLLPLHVHSIVSAALKVVVRGNAQKRFTIYEAVRLEHSLKQLMHSDGKGVLPSRGDLQLQLTEQSLQNAEAVLALKIQKLRLQGIDLKLFQFEERDRLMSDCQLDYADYADQERTPQVRTVPRAETQEGAREQEEFDQLRRKLQTEQQDSKKFIFSLAEEIRHWCDKHEERVSRQLHSTNERYVEHSLRLSQVVRGEDLEPRKSSQAPESRELVSRNVRTSLTSRRSRRKMCSESSTPASFMFHFKKQ